MTDTPPQLEGWTKWGGEEPFEDHAGPFFMKIDPNGGQHLSAFVCEKRHLNGGGFLHGGMLMSFADYALFVIAHDALETEHSVTVSCQTEFFERCSTARRLRLRQRRSDAQHALIDVYSWRNFCRRRHARNLYRHLKKIAPRN